MCVQVSETLSSQGHINMGRFFELQALRSELVNLDREAQGFASDSDDESNDNEGSQ